MREELSLGASLCLCADSGRVKSCATASINVDASTLSSHSKHTVQLSSDMGQGPLLLAAKEMIGIKL
jgi:hypothetical protein